MFCAFYSTFVQLSGALDRLGHASWVLPMSLSRGLSRAGGPGEKLFKKMKLIFLSS